MPLAFRKVEPSDRVALQSLVSILEAQVDITAELQRPWAEIWVASHEKNQLVGFVLGWRVADELQVLDVGTHPEWRRKGIARTLLEKMTHGDERTLSAVLEVRESNTPALELYSTLGFTMLRKRPGYYADTGEDALELVLTLGSSRERSPQ